MFFWNSCFFDDSTDVDNLMSGSSAFSKYSFNLEIHGSYTVEGWLEKIWALLCQRVRWVQLCGSLNILWHWLSLGLEWKLDPFESCGHCWVFQICWHIEYSTFTASSFRIWNRSSSPLALFIVMLPKAHLTFHSRMSGCRRVITPSWLSGSWRSFLYSSSLNSYYLFLISSASFRSIPFLWHGIATLLCLNLHEIFPWYL